jgi:hypothetical protein
MIEPAYQGLEVFEATRLCNQNEDDVVAANAEYFSMGRLIWRRRVLTIQPNAVLTSPKRLLARSIFSSELIS